MKKILFLALILGGFNAKAQTKTEDASRIVLTAVVPEQVEGLTPAAQTNLKNKLSQIITKNGMGGTAVNPRFIITANVVVLTKDITATAPPMQSYTLGVTLYIGDGIEGTLFSSTSVNLKGVGETETKAYMAALKNLKTDDPKYQAFIETGKNKIIDYYKSKCDFILKEAESLSTRNEFEAAIAKLLPEPNVAVSLSIPYNRGDLVSRMHLNSRITNLTYEEDGTHVDAMVTPEFAAELAQFSR